MSPGVHLVQIVVRTATCGGLSWAGESEFQRGGVNGALPGWNPYQSPTSSLVVFTLFPEAQLQPVRSGSTLHSSPSRHGCIWHHHFCKTIEASTQEGAARVVPATCPGKQEHFTVCDRSSILFLLQHRCRATTSQVPLLTW